MMCRLPSRCTRLAGRRAQRFVHESLERAAVAGKGLTTQLGLGGGGKKHGSSPSTLRGSQRERRMPPSCVLYGQFQENLHMFILLYRVLKTAWVALFLLPFSLAVALAQTQAPAVRLAMIEGLSGPNGNAGEAVYRNLVWAVERVNARGGVKLVLERYDSKGQNEEAMSALRSAIDNGARIVLQGNSSANAMRH
jgi:hypothetical protein